MAANNSLNITSVNFDVIVDNLKTYLRNQSEFRDYDFESSAMSTLINILAYNTYYNAFYLSMAASEQFLDSAQLRTNVVSKAKMLGYMPRSARGATAQLQATIVPDDSPTVITIAKNTEFQTSLGNWISTPSKPAAAAATTRSISANSLNSSDRLAAIFMAVTLDAVASGTSAPGWPDHAPDCPDCRAGASTARPDH